MTQLNQNTTDLQSILDTVNALPDAGGGNELTVTAPTGSTVTATKDGKTKTATEDNGVFTLKGLEAGTWTVTASKGTGTATQTVTFVDEQSITLSYIYANFAENDWATIIKACQSGNVPSTWVVGNSKPMTINGKSYQIDIIGKNHDTYTAGGTAPLTFQMHDCYDTKYPLNGNNTNSGGYDSAPMHTTYLPAILNLMPSEVKAAIKTVNKESGTGGGSTSGVETVSCKLFLLSEIEIFGTVTYSVAGEGTQYDYYKAGNSTIKYLNGTAIDWWERSPTAIYTETFCYVETNGTPSGYYANMNRGVPFAFCF